MVGLSLLVQVNHLEVERKAKLWRRTQCCLWLALTCLLMHPNQVHFILVPVAANTTVMSAWPCFTPC